MAVADYAEVVEAKLRPGQTPCSLCSRFRRGYLYDLAPRLGATKIALGHHLDDLIETLFLNMLFSGRLAAMPAKLHAEDGRNVVIRPLAYAAEEEIAAFAAARGFPIVPCDACGSQPQLRRRRVKALLAELSEEHPSVKANLLHALGQVVPAHLLDRGLLDRLATASGRDPWIDGGDEEEAPVALPSEGPLRRIPAP